MANKAKRLTPKQEHQASMYALAGALGGDYIMGRRLVELESVGRVLRSRFEGICSHPSCNEPPYLERTERLVDRVQELVALISVAPARVYGYEVNRDPRGAAIKLRVETMNGEREFYL